MGLDLVELVIAIEQHFEIDIPNPDAARLLTPGHIIEYLTPRLADRGRTVGYTVICPTQRAFHRLRKALQDRLGVPRSDVALERPLRNLIPWEGRARAWRDLQQIVLGDVADTVSPSSWPRLRRTSKVTWILTLMVLFSACLLLIGGANSQHPRLGVPLALCLTVMLAITVNRLTATWRTEFEPPNLTVGDLVRLVAAPTSLDRPKPEVWTRERIAEDVRAVVRYELGVDSFTDDARFIEDLGVG